STRREGDSPVVRAGVRPGGWTRSCGRTRAMSEREAFGPNLRRIRVQRGVSVHDITAATNVSAALWEGLERNDLTRWPTGIYARSYVRSYAKAIGVDPEATVDEFCRWFPQGDRRAEIVIRGHAEIVGHMDLQWRDHLPPS